MADRRTIGDIRANMDFVGCDNATAIDLCDRVEALEAALRKCADKLERCAVLAGTAPEYATATVAEYRFASPTKAARSKNSSRISDKFLTAVGKYLDANGWKVVLAGPCCVRKDAGPEYKFELCVSFIGAKRIPSPRG